MRLWDRVLSRDVSYTFNEAQFSGAYYLPGTDATGRGREGAQPAVVRHARDAFTDNGVVFGCVAARMALLSEARFTLQSTVDMHLFGTQALSILEYPWPNATAGELLARIEQDVRTAGNSYIRRATPADGSDDQLVQMRPDTVTIVSEEIRDDRGPGVAAAPRLRGRHQVGGPVGPGTPVLLRRRGGALQSLPGPRCVVSRACRG